MILMITMMMIDDDDDDGSERIRITRMKRRGSEPVALKQGR